MCGLIDARDAKENRQRYKKKKKHIQMTANNNKHVESTSLKYQIRNGWFPARHLQEIQVEIFIYFVCFLCMPHDD